MKLRMRWSLAARGAALLLAGAAVGCGGSPDHTEPAPVVGAAPATQTASAPAVGTAPATQTASAPVVGAAPATQTAPAPVVGTAAATQTAPAPAARTAATTQTASAPVVGAAPATQTASAPVVGTSPATQTAPAPVVRAAQATPAPAGDAVREPDLSATTADLAGGPAVAVFPSASSGDSSPRGGQFLDAETGPAAPRQGPSVAASAQGAEYTWQDGPTTRRMRLQLDLVAQPTSENRDDDVVAADQGELSIVRKQERHEQGAGEPVFRTESGHLVTFPGGMLIMLDGAWGAAQVQSFFARHGIAMSRVEGQTFGPNAFLVSSESGFAALELANDLAAEEGVVYAVPDRLIGADPQ